MQFVAALLGTILLTFLAMRDQEQQIQSSLYWDWIGVYFSVAAGVAVGLAEIISFFVSSLGVPAVQTIPIIIGGSVMFGTLLGVGLLQESLEWQGWFGVLLLILGIYLVGIDPGTVHVGHA